MRKKRNKRPADLRRSKGGYDSTFERVLHQTVLQDWQHHGDPVDYVIEHKYEPDFVKWFGKKKIIIEAKGRFWDHSEYIKYVWIRKAFEEMVEDYELVFLFSSPYSPMPQAKRRKDGTKRSHGEWATANDFKWFSEDTIPDSWINPLKRESFNNET